MPSVNRAIVIGHLGSDPDIRYTGEGKAVANLSVATTDKWKDRNGDRQEKTEWHRVVAFGQPADYLGKYAQKGNAVYVEGKMQTRKWQDKEGATRYTTELVASTVQLLGKNEPVKDDAKPQEEFQDDDVPF